MAQMWLHRGDYQFTLICDETTVEAIPRAVYAEGCPRFAFDNVPGGIRCTAVIAHNRSGQLISIVECNFDIRWPFEVMFYDLSSEE